MPEVEAGDGARAQGGVAGVLGDEHGGIPRPPGLAGHPPASRPLGEALGADAGAAVPGHAALAMGRPSKQRVGERARALLRG